MRNGAVFKSCSQIYFQGWSHYILTRGQYTIHEDRPRGHIKWQDPLVMLWNILNYSYHMTYDLLQQQNWVLLCPEGVPMRLTVVSVVDKDTHTHTHTLIYIYIYRNVSWYSISKMFYFIGNAYHIEHNKKGYQKKITTRTRPAYRQNVYITSVVVVIQW